MKHVVNIPGELFLKVKVDGRYQLTPFATVYHLFFDDSNLRCHVKAGNVNRWLYFDINDALASRYPYYYPDLEMKEDGIVSLAFSFEEDELVFISGPQCVDRIPLPFHQYF